MTQAVKAQPKLWEQFTLIAVQAFGKEFGKNLAQAAYERLQEGWRDHKTVVPQPQVSRLAVKDYLDGSAFGSMAREKVLAWTLWHLGQLPAPEAALVVRVARDTAGGGISETIEALVRYFYQREF